MRIRKRRWIAKSFRQLASFLNTPAGLLLIGEAGHLISWLLDRYG